MFAKYGEESRFFDLNVRALSALRPAARCGRLESCASRMGVACSHAPPIRQWLVQQCMCLTISWDRAGSEPSPHASWMVGTTWELGPRRRCVLRVLLACRRSIPGCCLLGAACWVQDLENTLGSWDMYGQEDKNRYNGLQVLLGAWQAQLVEGGRKQLLVVTLWAGCQPHLSMLCSACGAGDLDCV